MIFANLKMNFSLQEIIEYEKKIRNLNVVICPPDIYLTKFNKGKYILASQNVSIYENGPYTGEVSASQLKSANVVYSLVGHSERRKLFKEDSATFIKKIYNLVNKGIVPVYCLGETDRSTVEKYITKNIDEVFKTLKLRYRREIMIAYEPAWSISDGKNDKKIPETEYIFNVVSLIKNHIKEKYRLDVKVLYGGSVNAKNIETINNLGIIDGFLIGKASKDPSQLKTIIKLISKKKTNK